MAGRRPPLTDKQLRDAELEMRAQRLIADAQEGNPEVEQLLAAAGEPEAVAAIAATEGAPEALEALRAVHRGNIARLRPGEADAIAAGGFAADNAGSEVRDPADEAAAIEAFQKSAAERARIRKVEDTRATIEKKAARMMALHWKEWAKNGRKDHSKACLNMEFDVGQDAEVLVEGGVFDSHLAVVQFIQRMHAMTGAGRVGGGASDDWEEKRAKELDELRGDD